MTRLSLALALVVAFGCQCPPPPADGGSSDGGRVLARAASEGGIEIVLADLEAPLRVLQVDVVLAGGSATAVEPAGAVDHDLLEAALDAPRAELTLVVGDTRRVPLADGAIARLVTTGDATATLSNARAVDDNGDTVTLATGSGAP